MAAREKGRVMSGQKRQMSVSTMAKGPKKVFDHVVSSVDPEHFSAVDLPLLTEYATAAHQATVAAAALAASGTIVDGKASPWLIVQEKSVRAMVALSARLRICPQSRFDRLAAGSNSRPQWSGKKPWEDPDTDVDDGLLA